VSPAAGAWTGKVDQRIRALVAAAGGEPGGEVNVFVRFTGDPGDLAALGLTVRSVAGDIASASIPVADIPAAAGSPSVVLLELARPLAPDAG
jgi:hypothetical protein